MSNSVEAIFSKLKSKFNDHPSMENLVETIYGEIIYIDSDLWQNSAVLSAQSISAGPPKVLSVSGCTLEALIKAHRGGIFPDGLLESYDLLAGASELELRDLKSKCFQNLCRINALGVSVDIPLKLSLDSVMRFFKVMVDSPLRTVDVYEEQLDKIYNNWLNDLDVMTTVLNMLNQILEKFERINLEGIPADFGTRMLPVALYMRKGTPQTAVIVGTELKPVDLFGDRVDWGDLTGVSDFYLKYGQYLLYLSGDSVYYRDLQDRGPPIEKLSDCKIFLTRGNFVLAAHGNGPQNKISLWTNDERFEIIYQSDSEIKILEFDYDHHVLVVKLAKRKLLLFKLQNSNLLLLEEKEYSGMIDVLRSDGGMFYVRKSCEEAQIEVLCLPALCNEKSRQCDDHESDHGKNHMKTVESQDLTTWNSLRYFGGRYFLTENKRLELVTNFPSSEEAKTLLTDGELLALSELWMSP